MTCPLLILFEWRGNCSRFCKTKPSTSISLDYHVDFGVLVKLQKVDKTCIVAQIWTILSRMTGKVLTGCTMTEETKRAFSTFWTRGREGWISVVRVSFTAVWSQFQHQWPNRTGRTLWRVRAWFWECMNWGVTRCTTFKEREREFEQEQNLGYSITIISLYCHPDPAAASQLQHQIHSDNC